MRFDELDLEDAVLDGLDAMNFLETTPVQELTIPVILSGKDIIACAQTGTGKTDFKYSSTAIRFGFASRTYGIGKIK